MNRGVLMNDIELAFAPISTYHFYKLIRDKEFQNNFLDSHLYIIAQRKELTFNNFNFSVKNQLQFEIWQENNPNKIRCKLPFIQENITTDETTLFELRLHDRKNQIDRKNKFPFNGTQGFSIKAFDKDKNSSELLVWFSPDRLLHSLWKEYINADISNDFEDMFEFYVHYVGKSTEQNICTRLTNHSTFQEILANETSLSYANIPSNEIMILLFRIKDVNTIASWGAESDSKEISDYLINYKAPNDKTILLDAEKAIVKNLQPKYNRILFKTFPNKNDLVNSDKHDVIMYSFGDPIKLIYDNGTIKGGNLYDKKDYISVKNK